VILDPAPVTDLPGEICSQIDLITPNEIEAAQLVGFPVNNREDAFRATDALLDLDVRVAIIKLGAEGVVFASHNHEFRGFIKPFPVTAVDTVAAGDAFNGGLAVAVRNGKQLMWANEDNMVL
jgi:ribokinase